MMQLMIQFMIQFMIHDGFEVEHPSALRNVGPCKILNELQQLISVSDDDEDDSTIQHCPVSMSSL